MNDTKNAAPERMPFDEHVIQRFWEKVDKRSEAECWPWMGEIDLKGYPRFWVNNKKVKAHRVSRMIADGVSFMPTEQHVCHACDTPACVNPSHLWIGSHTDNMLDSVKKGRHYLKAKTHCPHGHPLSGDNVRVRRTNGHERRICKACHRFEERIRSGRACKLPYYQSKEVIQNEHA